MPLDPLLKALLDQMAAQPAPPMWEMEPAMAREAFVAMMDAIGPKGVAIGKTVNVTMPGPGGEIDLRVYTPVAAGSDALPGLVFFHGGGWVIGDLETHDGLCRILANEAGVRVIAVHYRLAPDHKFPAALDDAVAAVNWVEANAASLGVDANRLAVGGDSAGGGDSSGRSLGRPRPWVSSFPSWCSSRGGSEAGFRMPPPLTSCS